MLVIKGYYHFVEEFKDIDYSGYDCEEEDSVKKIKVDKFEDIVKFAKKNNLKIDILVNKVLLVRDNSVFGEVVRIENL